MRPPIFVRPLTESERERLEVGLRSPEVNVLRRCQSLLASARGERVPRIAATLDLIREFERDGLEACLTRGSSRPHTLHAKVDAVAGEHLLTANELADRVCEAYGCPHQPHLTIPEKVA